MALVLPEELRRRLEAAAAARYPREACGLLAGRSEGATRFVELACECPNLRGADGGERFELDPGALVAFERAARARGLALLGTWHSHPDAAARPSAHDDAAAWSGWISAILAVRGGVARELRAWRWAGGGYREEPVEARGARVRVSAAP